MENCFKYRLKANANNNSLNKLGEFSGKVTNTASSNTIRLEYIQGSHGYVRSTGALYMSSSSALSNLTQELTGAVITAYFTSNEGNFFVGDKYNLVKVKRISGISPVIDIKEFKYCTNLTECSISTNQNITGDIANLANLTLLTTLSPYNTSVYGELVNLKKCVALTMLQINGTNISGSIESLATAMAPNRNEGTLTIMANGIISLNGTAVNNGTWKYVKFGTNLPSGAEASGTGWAVYGTNPDA